MEKFFPKVAFSDDFAGRTFAVADVHGCPKTLKKLVEHEISLKSEDRLFLLGDYIDRGPDSRGALELVMDWCQSNRNIIALRGNHEASLLSLYREYSEEEIALVLTRITKTPELLDKKGRLPEKYIDFIETLPFYAESGNFLLVHGGFDVSKVDPFSDYSSMIQLYVDPQSYKTEILRGKTVIYGHKVTDFDVIEQRILNREQLIPLDNGCAFTQKHKIYDYTKLGSLYALQLDTFDIFKVRNIDF